SIKDAVMKNPRPRSASPPPNHANFVDAGTVHHANTVHGPRTRPPFIPPDEYTFEERFNAYHTALGFDQDHRGEGGDDDDDDDNEPSDNLGPRLI
ncbi:hypothetical protein H0H93_007156, partial [Arthromyces matolae]